MVVQWFGERFHDFDKLAGVEFRFFACEVEEVCFELVQAVVKCGLNTSEMLACFSVRNGGGKALGNQTRELKLTMLFDLAVHDAFLAGGLFNDWEEACFFVLMVVVHGAVPCETVADEVFLVG